MMFAKDMLMGKKTSQVWNLENRNRSYLFMNHIDSTQEYGLSGNLKASQFNEYLGNINDKWVVVNHFSSAMIEVDQNVYDSLLTDHIAGIRGEKRIDALKHGKFIVDETVDEVAVLKKINRQMTDSAFVVGLQILPTMACNFKCPYCYENAAKNKSHMSKEVMDNLIDYVNQKVKPTTRNFNVSWFGGEPLLAMEQINYLSQAFLKLAQERRIRYNASLVSNGYLLDKENVDALIRDRISLVQVTIDGPQRFHDQRRVLHNGEGTWQTIIDNLKYPLSKGMSVVVRMNIDKSNIDYIEELIEVLKQEEIFDKIRFSLGLVYADGDVCRSVEDNLLTLADAEKRIDRERLKELLQGSKKYARRIPADFIGCVAVAAHSLIVGPTGDLYKCGKTIGKAGEVCGHIAHPDSNHPNRKKWENFHNLDAEGCKPCALIPVCRGRGCAYDYIIGSKKEICCDSQILREEYAENLKLLYKNKKSASQSLPNNNTGE